MVEAQKVLLKQDSSVQLREDGVGGGQQLSCLPIFIGSSDRKKKKKDEGGVIANVISDR